jgi:bis(5'-nucleosyl)-tetraphosphatase (symmetrical)
MALYLIGDVQGCDAALQRLLDTIGFTPSRDTLFLLGDLVNRGPASEAVLRRLMGYGNAARCLLGNHDLHLLAVDAGVRSATAGDTLDGVLYAPDRATLLHWLRHQRLAMLETVGDTRLLMVHAGVLPAWSAAKTMALAGEVEAILQSCDARSFLKSMYGSTPTAWNDTLTGEDRSRVIVNALTRLRFCTASGAMEFTTKDSAKAAPPGYMPWFEVPDRQTVDITVAFGHWSTLGWLGRSDVLAMDTGCLWGGCLSALRIETSKPGQPWNTELVQVKCDQARRPDTKPIAP